MRVKSFTSYSPSGSITGLGLQVTSGHCNHPSTERQSSQRPVGRGTETSMCAIACIIGTGPVKSSNYTTRHLGQYCCRYLLSSRMFIRSRAFGTRISVCASVRLTAHAQRVPLPAGPLLKQATSFMIYLQLASLGLSNVIPGHTGSYLQTTSLACTITSCNLRHKRPPPPDKPRFINATHLPTQISSSPTAVSRCFALFRRHSPRLLSVGHGFCGATRTSVRRAHRSDDLLPPSL